MRKLLLSALFVLSATIITNAQDKSWNFSEWELQEFSSETTIDDLTIVASESAKVSIDGNKKSYEDLSFTQRLKLGGGGGAAAGTFLPTNRYVSFEVTGDATITVYGMSSSSNTERTLVFSDGEQSLGTLVNDGNALGKQVVEYKGGATTIYLYSASSGFNIYAISVAYGTDTTGIPSTGNDSKAVQSVSYYDLTGRTAGIHSKGILIEKTTYEDGSSDSKKIIKTRQD